MPLFLPTPCQTCGTGHPWPAEAAFCRNCGRPARWSETPAGRRRAAVVAAVGVLLVVGLVVLGLIVATGSRTAVAARVMAARRAPTPPLPQGVTAPVPPSTPVPPAVPRPLAPATPSADAPTPAPAAPPVDPDPPPSVPARPGDTDLAALPLSAYAGGPSGEHLTVHGVGLGVAVSAVPAALVAERSTDHLKDVGGNVYDLDHGRIAQVHVREPAVLDRMPIDGTHALLARFGDPDRPPQDVGAQMFVLQYPERGLDVRWDDGVQHLDEVTLYRPRSAR